MLSLIFICCAVLWPMGVSASISAAKPPAEFLDDDGRTAWDAWRDRARARIKFAAQVVGVLAAVAGIASAIELFAS